MLGGDDWAPPTAASVYGLGIGGRSTSGAPTGLAAVSAPSVAGSREESALHPDNPLVMFGVIAALTFGLMAFSTSVRVGGTTASVAIGKA